MKTAGEAASSPLRVDPIGLGPYQDEPFATLSRSSKFSITYIFSGVAPKIKINKSVNRHQLSLMIKSFVIPFRGHVGNMLK